MNKNKLSRAERMRGALWGMFVGDALVLQRSGIMARLWAYSGLPGSKGSSS